MADASVHIDTTETTFSSPVPLEGLKSTDDKKARILGPMQAVEISKMAAEKGIVFGRAPSTSPVKEKFYYLKDPAAPVETAVKLKIVGEDGRSPADMPRIGLFVKPGENGKGFLFINLSKDRDRVVYDENGNEHILKPGQKMAIDSGNVRFDAGKNHVYLQKRENSSSVFVSYYRTDELPQEPARNETPAKAPGAEAKPQNFPIPDEIQAARDIVGKPVRDRVQPVSYYTEGIFKGFGTLVGQTRSTEGKGVYYTFSLAPDKGKSILINGMPINRPTSLEPGAKVTINGKTYEFKGSPGHDEPFQGEPQFVALT